jgi:hypothetical protein
VAAGVVATCDERLNPFPTVDAVRLIASVVVHRQLSTARNLLEKFEPNAVDRAEAIAREHSVEAWLAQCAPSERGPWWAPREQRLSYAAAHTRELAALRGIGEVLDVALTAAHVVKNHQDQAEIDAE